MTDNLPVQLDKTTCPNCGRKLKDIETKEVDKYFVLARCDSCFCDFVIPKGLL